MLSPYRVSTAFTPWLCLLVAAFLPVAGGWAAERAPTPVETARAAIDMFGRLGALDAWVAESATTKTAFAYGLDPTFCD